MSVGTGIFLIAEMFSGFGRRPVLSKKKSKIFYRCPVKLTFFCTYMETILLDTFKYGDYPL